MIRPTADRPTLLDEHLERAFEDWRGRYSYAFEDGGRGDLVELWEALSAAAEKALSASCVAPSATCKSFPADTTERT